MWKYLAAGIVCGTLALSAVSAGELVTEKELIDQLRPYESMKSLEVSFTQIKELKALDVRLNSEGHFKIVRPDQVTWEITRPSPVRVTLDRKEILIESGAGGNTHKQLLKLGDSLPDRAARSITGLIAWLNLDAKSLYRQYLVFHAGNQTFRFEPREKSNSPFQTLEMTLANQGHLKRLVIHEISGDSLNITFGKPKLTLVKP